MSDTTSQNADLTPADIKGHICFSFNGGACGCGGKSDGGNAGGGAIKVDRALNFALLAPEGTTWSNFSQNVVIESALPKSVAVNKAYTLPSPFGQLPCVAVAYVKNPHTAQWQEISSYSYTNNAGLMKVGVKVSCPGDGNVYLATGTNYLAQSAVNSQGHLAPAATAGSDNFTAAEMVIGLWCATGEALAEAEAFKALEARVAVLEAKA